jgi:hypothetical protein
MKETDLVNYFKKRVSSEDLHQIILYSVTKKGLITKININDDLKEAYVVTNTDIVNICDDYLTGIFNGSDLYVIGFILFNSDTIEIEEGPVGDRVLDVVGDWANADINEPITRDVILKSKRFILNRDIYK